MPRAEEAYKDGLRDARSLSMDEKIDTIYARQGTIFEKLFIEKNCFRDRIVKLETGLRAVFIVGGLILAPVTVALILRVFFGI